MKTPDYTDTIYRVAADTLESLAMMYLLDEGERPKCLPPCDTQAMVTFTGPFDGALVVSASGNVRPELAANMLGLGSQTSATSEQEDDALKELANVICGNLLPAIAGREVVFHISAPSLPETDELAAMQEQFSPVGQTQLVTDAGVIQLTLLAGRMSAVGA